MPFAYTCSRHVRGRCPTAECDCLGGISVAGMAEAGILESKRDKVRLPRPEELSADWDPAMPCSAMQVASCIGRKNAVLMLGAGVAGAGVDMVAFLFRRWQNA